ncbi:MAG: hypothetical protein JWL98_2089, partial [Xanthomonadaceae bacterium]|nr:hypothetical protein [Xanthomonadaceae bacterium]
MFRSLMLAAAVAMTVAAPALAQPADSTRALNQLFADEWERGMVESPESASANGDNRYNDRWTDETLAAIAKREGEDRAALAKLHTIERASLAPADQLNYDTFEWQLQRAVERQKFHEFLQPVNHQGGVQTADGLAEVLPFASVKDYHDWLKRMDAVPTLVDQTIVLMREGARTGNVPPKVLMQRVPAQIAAQVVDDPTKSPFYRPFLKFSDAISPGDRATLQAHAQQVIRDRLVPAYRRFAAFVDHEYLPKTRESVAAAGLPDGKAYYDFLARYYTTTDLSAAQIHAIGLKEVARIRGEMEKVKAQTGFTGSMPEFFNYLRTDPRFFEKTPEALLIHYRALAKRIDPELVKVFKIIPRQPYGVRPIPDNIAPDTTTAYYQQGASDGSRPGYYYVNLFKPEVRPTWEMMPLSLHESVPGHHFQFARALELP